MSAYQIALRYSLATPRPWGARDVTPRHPGVYPWIGWTDPDGSIESVVETQDATATDRANVRLIVAAVNEYESLHGLGQYARHYHGCAATRTNGGLNAPGPCDCGFADWLAKWKEASGE